MQKYDDRYLRVSKIKNGTVIDHLNPLYTLDIIKILGLHKWKNIVTSAINVPSNKLGKKGIIKIEDKLLKEDETNIIALLSPSATINKIKDYKVIGKKKVELPDKFEGIISCTDPLCITNSGKYDKGPKEKVIPKFYVVSKEPVILKCYYCERTIDSLGIIKQFKNE